MFSKPFIRHVASAVALVTTVLAAPAAASATTASVAPSSGLDVFTRSGSCAPAPTSQPFARLDGDAHDYSVAPGGTFESGSAGWTLAGGARIVSGNESKGVATGSRSLRLPIGATATSPKFCVDESYPHFRFAYKVDGGFAGFVAFVVYQKAGVTTTAQLVSSEKLSITPSTWSLTPASPLATLLPLSGGSASVQIKLMAVTVAGDRAAFNTVGGAFANGAASVAEWGVSVDSVMVDPYRRS